MIIDPVLSSILKPLSRHYEDTEVTEVRLSQPYIVTIERRGQPKFDVHDDNLSIGTVERISANLANKHGISFDTISNPNISCTLPKGHRFECLVGSSVQSGLSLAIRCKHPFDAHYSDYGLDTNIADFIKDAVIAGKHIVVSGGTNTGKTTLLNLMLKCLPIDTRLVVLEDTPEINFDKFTDSVGLIASRSGSSKSMLKWSGLYDHSNRITPDRLIFSEISTHNAEAAIALMNSGASGFMCTIHSTDSYQTINRRFDQILSLSDKRIPNLPSLLEETIDIVIQIVRSDGNRFVSDIFLPKENRYQYQRSM